jgi:hypothetical protein
VIPTSPLRKLELSTKSQFQVGSLSTTFLIPLALISFLVEAKRTFINFPMTHHNLGSCRAMPSHIGGFTSKSNKCHKDCFTKLKCSQKGSSSLEGFTSKSNKCHGDYFTKLKYSQKRSHSILTWISHKSHKPH